MLRMKPQKIIGKPNPGILIWMGVSSGKQSEIQPLNEAVLEKDKGLVLDYHAKSGSSIRQVTLFQNEHLGVITKLLNNKNVLIDYTAFRRNLVVRGINLISLIGHKFKVGKVLLEGTGPCDPCKRMEETLGPGGLAAMHGHGGITAIVIEGGTIRPGDQVEIVLE